MSKQEVVISVQHVSKDFTLPHEKVDSVKSLFVNPFSSAKRNEHIETQHALDDVSFEIKKGEFFGIVGRNGSGKSTLLKLIANIYQPTEGEITVNGRLVPFIELGVGFNPELSGRENVYLNGALMGYSSVEIDKKYQAIVDFAELERFMDQKLKNYSSGMQVRLAFSVATVLANSDILLIDEVLAVGDADFQRKCFRYFQRLKRDKKTVIFVTHDMNAVREYCDRAVLIEKSKLIASGTANKIALEYEKLMQPKVEQVKEEEEEEEPDRWGDGTLKIESANVDYVSDKTIKLSATIRAMRDCEDPVAGFTIHSQSGVILVGTNTNIVNHRIAPMRKGDTVVVKWELVNSLSDGEYDVAIAAQYDRGATNGEWWDGACHLTVTRQTHNPFPIYPQAKVSLEQ